MIQYGIVNLCACAVMSQFHDRAATDKRVFAIGQPFSSIFRERQDLFNRCDFEQVQQYCHLVFVSSEEYVRTFEIPFGTGHSQVGCCLDEDEVNSLHKFFQTNINLSHQVAVGSSYHKYGDLYFTFDSLCYEHIITTYSQ